MRLKIYRRKIIYKANKCQNMETLKNEKYKKLLKIITKNNKKKRPPSACQSQDDGCLCQFVNIKITLKIILCYFLAVCLFCYHGKTKKLPSI